MKVCYEMLPDDEIYGTPNDRTLEEMRECGQKRIEDAKKAKEKRAAGGVLTVEEKRIVKLGADTGAIVMKQAKAAKKKRAAGGELDDKEERVVRIADQNSLNMQNARPKGPSETAAKTSTYAASR